MKVIILIPLSLKFALNKFNNLKIKSNRKLILLGDMLELGKYSQKLHRKAAQFINNTKIDKVYVYGKELLKHLTKLNHKKEEKY